MTLKEIRAITWPRKLVAAAIFLGGFAFAQGANEAIRSAINPAPAAPLPSLLAALSGEGLLQSLAAEALATPDKFSPAFREAILAEIVRRQHQTPATEQRPLWPTVNGHVRRGESY